RAQGDIVEYSASAIPVKRLEFVRKVRSKNTFMSISGKIACRHSHTGHCLSILVKGNATKNSVLFELAVPLVDVKKRGRLIAGDIDIRQTVFIEVSRQNTEAVVTHGARNAALLGNIGKSSIAVVAIQNVAIEGQAARSAIHGDAAVVTVGIRPSSRSRSWIELQVIRDKQIQMPVQIHIDKRASSVIASPILRQMRGRSHILKPLAADISIEMIRSPGRDKKIGAAIVIVIARADAFCPSVRTQSYFIGHIAKSILALVVIHPVCPALS